MTTEAELGAAQDSANFWRAEAFKMGMQSIEEEKEIGRLRAELSAVRACFAEASHAAGPTAVHVDALKAENAELRGVLAAALRLEAGGYLEWAAAGGPGECAHGRAEGIPCRACDRQAVLYRGADLLR